MILLTSSIATSAEHLYKNFLQDKNYKTVLFIDTAAENDVEDGDWLIDDLNSIKKQGFEVDRYTLTGHSRNEIEEKISNYDIIYMCGGNTFYLLQQMQKTNSLELIRDVVLTGKPYIGTSAGSLIAAKDIAPTDRLGARELAPDLKDTNGLDLVNFLALPHWGSRHYRDIYLGERMEKMYEDIDHKYILLNDYQYVNVIENGYIKILDSRDS
jgi:dipeptidase E